LLESASLSCEFSVRVVTKPSPVRRYILFTHHMAAKGGSMSRIASVLFIGLFVSTISFAGPKAINKREQLANQSRERITKIIWALTTVNWVGRANSLLSEIPAGKALGARWNPSEPHWDKAVDTMLNAVMKTFDNLHDAPEARARMDMPFQSGLTEAEAAEILALSAEERKLLDDYADTTTLAIQLLDHRSELRVGSREFKQGLAPLVAMVKLPDVTARPKVTLPEKTMGDYQQARAAGVDFLRTVIDGQLQLFFFDHSAEMRAIASKAAEAAGKATPGGG
jgi:hypothetical protein